MRADRIMLAAHWLALGFALLVAVACPRPGDPALLVPLGAGGMGAGVEDAIAWAGREDARFLALDTRSAAGATTGAGGIVALVPDHASLLSALSAGLVPIAADTVGCAGPIDGEEPWKN